MTFTILQDGKIKLQGYLMLAMATCMLYKVYSAYI